MNQPQQQARKGCRLSAEVDTEFRRQVLGIPDNTLLGYVRENDDGTYTCLAPDGTTVLFPSVNSRSRAAVAVRRKFEEPKPCTEGGDWHQRVKKDDFMRLPGVRRSVAGDCFCLDCNSPIRANWNGGNPVAIEE